MPAAIAIQNLHKHYDSVHALKGVSFSIEQGEFFALLGPNGAGKSTLIGILAGLTRPTSGTAAVLGHDVIDDYQRARRALGVVPQEVVFDPFFTVREVLRIQAGYYGLGRAHYDWIEHIMSALMLMDKADSNMRTLSGGMKRRVLVAQALVHKPPVVVLDEPTAGVDVELRKSLWNLLRDLHREGRTIVLTTHYLEEAQSLCNRIAILNRGNLVALDSTQTLLNRYGNRAKELHVTLEQPVSSLPTRLQELIRQQDGTQLVFGLQSTKLSATDILAELKNCGAPVADFHTAHANLEDIFVTLTTGDHS